MLASSRTPRRRKHTGWAAASGGGISGQGNPSDRAWRRGHLPLTREANCGAGPATNRETMILMLLRTRVGADSISARSAAAQTPPGGYGIRPYNGFFNVAANRETTILALPRTCVGDDACIVPHPTAAQTHRVGSRFRGGGISGRGNPSDRAWRRGHLPLTREANCGAGPATNRETVILMLLRTRVGADSTAPAGAFRRPTGPQVRLLGRRYRPGLRRRKRPRADMESAPTWVFHGIRPPRAAGFL